MNDMFLYFVHFQLKVFFLKSLVVNVQRQRNILLSCTSPLSLSLSLSLSLFFLNQAEQISLKTF